MVPAKDPLKVKLEIFSQHWCARAGVNYAYLVFLRALGFYSSVESTFVSCIGRHFLIGKIIINGCILRNPPHVRILFILRLYELGLIVRCKLFPFRIPWRLLKLGGCLVATRPVHLVSVHFRSIHYQSTSLE